MSEEYTPQLGGWVPRGALKAIQNERPSKAEIAAALELFGHIETVRTWAVGALLKEVPAHRQKSAKIAR